LFIHPGLSGLDLFDALREKGTEISALVMSGATGRRLASESASRGCLGFIEKPFYFPLLIGQIRQAIEGRAPSPDG